MTYNPAIEIGNISQISGMLAVGGDVVVGNKTVIQQIVPQREFIVHPYKFLSAYDISDKDIFFGRDALTKQLAGKISRHKILLLNGAPGAGKSSLINAGLIPYLAENGYTYLSFRDYSNPVQQLQNCLIDSGILSVANSHPEFLAHTLIALRNSKLQMVFIFDQFERFFVHVPPAARMQFIEMIKICMETLPSTEMNVVFAVREKFFGQFQREFEELIHAFLNECERVNIAPLSKLEARQAIVNPLTLTETKIGYDDEFVDNILLVGLEAEIVEKGISPSHLQIVCNQLYQAACQQLELKHFVVIDHKLYEQLGGTETILRTYLDDCISTVANHEIAHIQLLHSILKQMIETVGIRKFVTVQQLYLNLPDVATTQIDDFLTRLQDARVIEVRSQVMYSLSHEFMVAKVQDWFDEREMARKRAEETLEHGLNEWKNSETLLTEKQIKRIRDAQIKLNAEEDEFLRSSETECDKQRREEEEQIRQIDLGRDAHQKALDSKRKIMQVGLVVTIMLTVIAIEFAIDSYNKLKQVQKTESLLLADLSRQTLEKGDATTAILLALEALPKNMIAPDRPYVAEAEHSLYAALSRPYKELVLSHEGWLNGARFSPDGKKVVTASGDNTAQIWNAATGDFMGILQGHEDSVRHAEFSPDGQMVVTASRDHTVKIWKASGEFLKTLQHNDSVNHAQFSSDNQKIVTASEDHATRIWTATGELLKTLLHDGAVKWAQFDHDEQRVVTASHDRTARIWEVATGNELAKLEHTSIINSAEFSLDGRFVITASHDRTAKIWEVETGKQLIHLKHEDEVNYAEFSPDGQRIVTASSDNTAKLWNINGELIATLLGHKSAVTHAKFSSKGQLITTSKDKTARLWNANTGQLLNTFGGHRGIINYAEFNPDGDKVITTSFDKTARIWERNIDYQTFLNLPKKPKYISTLYGHEGRINTAKFSLDGRQIVSASEDKTARIWDTENGKLQTQLSGHIAGIKYAEFNAGVDKVVTASEDKTVRLWDLKDQRILPEPLIFKYSMAIKYAKFAFFEWIVSTADNSTIIWDTDNERLFLERNFVFETSADEQKLLLISDNSVKIFSIDFVISPNDIQPTRILPHPGKVDFAQFSKDGQRVITVSDKEARIWDISIKSASSPILLTHQVPINHVALSSDGRKVISAAGNEAFLWDADNGQRPIMTLPHTNPVTYTEFSLDGQKMLTVSEDNKIYVWRISLSTQELIEEAQNLKSRDLTIEQREQYFLPVPDSMRRAQEKIIDGKRSAKSGHLEEAQQAFEEAIKLDNTLRFDPHLKAQILTANYLLNQGKQLAEAGKSEAAIAVFTKLHDINPHFQFDPRNKAIDILMNKVINLRQATQRSHCHD